MPFAFRLERVLSVRRLQEETAQQRHAEALERKRAAEAALADLRSRLLEALDDLDGVKRRDELTAEALYLHSLHLAGLRRGVAAARQESSLCAAEAQRTESELLDAHRAVEAMEKLRERDEAAWKRAESAREARAIDEVAVTRHRAREEENHGP